MVGVCNSRYSWPKKEDEPKSVILIVQFVSWLFGLIKFMGMMAWVGACGGWMGWLSVREMGIWKGSPKRL